MKWIIAGVISAVVGVVLGIVVGFAVVLLTGPGFAAPAGGGAAPGPNMASTMVLIGIGQAAIQFLVAIVFMVGFWLLTSPDPAEDSGAPPVNARTLARFVLLAWLVSRPLTTMLSQSYSVGAFGGTGGAAGGPAAFLNSTAFAILGIIASLTSLAAIVGFVALFIHARRLALRIPNPAIAGQTRVVMWGLVSAMGIELLLTATFAVFGKAWMSSLIAPAGGTPTMTPVTMIGMAVLGVAGCAIGLLRLTFGIWAIVLMAQFLSAFRNAAAQARIAWAIGS